MNSSSSAASARLALGQPPGRALAWRRAAARPATRRSPAQAPASRPAWHAPARPLRITRVRPLAPLSLRARCARRGRLRAKAPAALWPCARLTPAVRSPRIQPAAGEGASPAAALELASALAQLAQDLRRKDEDIRLKDEDIRRKDEDIRRKDAKVEELQAMLLSAATLAAQAAVTATEARPCARTRRG